MRLLNTETGVFEAFEDPQKVRYAILSHVWSKPEDHDFEPEQTYQKTCQIIDGVLAPGTSPLSQYSRKIRNFCTIAREDGFKWGWVDSSCIDKTSSAELSEAINSMYDWYRYSGICYVFLHDLDEVDISDTTSREKFGSSKWFHRGWTLQELLAPMVLQFLSSTWCAIGTKYTLASLVESVTGIDSSILTFNKPLEDISVARKMSWAASRNTTKVEDEAYSLMGIFGVTISISYGEGRNAFIRLQEQILKHYPDQTIFAWGNLTQSDDFRFAPPDHVDKVSTSLPIPPSQEELPLASRPHSFNRSSTFQRLTRDEFSKLLGISPELMYQEFAITPYGIRAHVPLLSIYGAGRHDPHYHLPTHLALLACEDQDRNILALLLRPQPQTIGLNFLVGAVVGHTHAIIGHPTLLQSYYYRVTFLSHDQILSLRKNIRMVDLYIPHRPSIAVQKLELEEGTHSVLRARDDCFEVRLSGWSRTLLKEDGYTITPEKDDNVVHRDGHLDLTPSSASTTSAVTINKKGGGDITIRVGRCLCQLGEQQKLLAVTVSAPGQSSTLGEKEIRQHTKMDDPAHVQSWNFRGGFASKEVQLDSTSSLPMITLRLTFSRDTHADTHLKAYRLGVEILPPVPFEPPLSVSPLSLMPTEPPNPPKLKLTRSYSQVAASPINSPARPVPSTSTTWPPHPHPRASRLRNYNQFNSASQLSTPKATPRHASSIPLPLQSTPFEPHRHDLYQYGDSGSERMGRSDYRHGGFPSQNPQLTPSNNGPTHPHYQPVFGHDQGLQPRSSVNGRGRGQSQHQPRIHQDNHRRQQQPQPRRTMSQYATNGSPGRGRGGQRETVN